MTKEKHKQRFGLTLLLSFFVFVIITVAAGLSVAIIYLLAKTGLARALTGQLNIINSIVFMWIISMIIGFLLTMTTGKISLKPVNRIINQLNKLAKGDFSARMEFGKPIGYHPAFKEIENSFNRAAEELEHTEMLRGDFINNFSHEFKTPIVSIAGFAKLLRCGNLNEKEKEEYIAIIEEESLRLSYMATNILNLTRVENQKILTNVSKFNLSEQIRGAVLLLADKWSQKNIEMDMEFGEYFTFANEELLKQVWINLLDNAIKFSEPYGTVSVTVCEKEESICVSVKNSGKDIPKESLERIFNKFYQADESHSAAGNGIGLAIVKKVVDLHNGKVTAKSEKGITEFTVVLPCRQ